MKKMLFYVAIFFALLFGWYGAKKIMFWWFLSHYQPPPVTVSATTAHAQEWQSYLSGISTLIAVNGVDLSAEVPGIVSEIHFNSGQIIKRGETVLILQKGVEDAQLKGNQAKYVLAKLDYDRLKSLLPKHAASQQAVDTKYAELLQTAAQVELVQAQIKQKTITAPFDGRLGIRLVNVGEYISAGKPIVTLQALHPLYVNINFPEQYLSDLYINQPVEVTVNLGRDYSVRGTVTAINSKVDPVTRNISIQATIPNSRQNLYPGMFGLAKVWLKAKNKVIIVPQTAISYSLSGNFVFLIKEKNKDQQKQKNSTLHVYRQYVKIGERRGDKVVILQGLNAGDQIVTSGQLKLQNDSLVVINNSVEL